MVFGSQSADREVVAAAFDTLRHATDVSFGGVGIANILSAEAKAYGTICATGSAHHRKIRQLLYEATPAGRVYAATLLTQLDAAEGRQAWEHLASQHDSLKVQGGCVVSTSTLSRYANEQLAKMGVQGVQGVQAVDAVDRVEQLPPTLVAPNGTSLADITLRDLLADGPVHPARLVKIITEVAEALDVIHSRSRVHGGICPENIVIGLQDSVQLTEKAIAAGEFDKLTAVDVDTAMFPYAAPELFSSGRSEPSADIYALACVLYECLTGEPPFPGPNLERQITGHLVEVPPRPSVARPDLPARFDRVVSRGMAKNPIDRYRTAFELARDAQGRASASAGQPFAAKGHPSVDVAGRRIVESLQADPRIGFVSARDEQHFVKSLFPQVDPRTAVYVSRETRVGNSRGPHFDLYQSIVHPDYPFVATLNLVGSASVAWTVLHPTLTSYYFQHHPVPTEDAYTARRLVSAMTLEHPGARVQTDTVEPGVGMIIPQFDGALPLVHNVQPRTAYGQDSHGLFLKFIVPRADASAMASLAGQGFAPWQPGMGWYDESEMVAVQAELEQPKLD